MSLPKYPAYKDSGVPWLGEIPEHWDAKRLKRLAFIRNGSDYKHIEAEDGYPVIGSGGIFTMASKYIFDGESVLLGRKGTIDKPLYINGAFWTVDTMFYTVMKSGVYAKYIYYCARTIQFDLYSTSTALPSMTQADLLSIFFAIPELDEQTLIAQFLDRETSKIDELITEQEKLIKLLDEKRQAMISHAVTKGLNPDAPMNDSGVDWIGEIPTNWQVVGLTKYLETLVDYRGKTPTKTDDGILLVTARNIKSGYIDYQASEEFISEHEYNEVMRRGFPAHGDVLFTTEASLGQVANVDKTNIALAQRIIKFRGQSDILNNYFLKYWILGDYCQADLEQLATGSTALGIKGSKVGQVRLCLPPHSEQVKLVAYLDQQTAQLDTLKITAQNGIELLKERRSALISAAVTGKIDVRGLVNTEAA